MKNIKRSGICKIASCDKHQYIDGYCKLHGEYHIQKEIVRLLTNIDDKLDKLRAHRTVETKVIYRPDNITHQQSMEPNIKHQNTNDEIFIPSVSIESAQVSANHKLHMASKTKEVTSIANKLRKL